ncbi:MAG: mechanosensitive ion channel family protein [Firmicutes bacterium]|nr:mechanosensitive ion channel family protein [Bacillota bacterium]
MENWAANLTELATKVGGKILLALVVLIVGSFLIKKVLRLVGKSKALTKLEASVRSFALSFIKILLYVVLIVSVINILGVPMASVVTVLASAGVAVGLALQGALSNLAGGLMLMIFKPFRVGDYVEAAGVEGVVQEITMFYTVILTLDNKRITVPNGSLMNANVTNYSSEELRRVDLVFSCAKSETPSRIQDLLLQVMKDNPQVLDDPEPFARLSGGTNEAMEFTVRAWCKNADYWDVFFDLTQASTETFAANGVKAPAMRVLHE